MLRAFAIFVVLLLLAVVSMGYYALRPLPLPATPFEITLRRAPKTGGDNSSRHATLAFQPFTLVQQHLTDRPGVGPPHRD